MEEFPLQDIVSRPGEQETVVLTAEEQEAVASINAVQSVPKGTLLLAEGELSNHSIYVVEGCVRQFHSRKGQEMTSYFYTEGESVFFLSAASQHVPSRFSLQCLEDCRLSMVSFEDEAALCQRFPRFHQLCRASTETTLAKFQELFAEFISSSPEERYVRLVDRNPKLLNRVPQYHLASYLGVKPESLSRIRKRIAERR